MEFSNLIELLDDSKLTREVIGFRRKGGEALSYANYTSENLSATVNEEVFNELLRICLLPKEKSVTLYINNVAIRKLTNIDLEDVSTFSIS